MHETTRAHLEGVEAGGPNKTAFGRVASRLGQRVFDRAVCNFVIAIDILQRDGFHFTARCHGDSRLNQTRHSSHPGAIREQPVPQIARGLAKSGECPHTSYDYATAFVHPKTSSVPLCLYG
jgi:hypothetical protein